MTITWVGMTRQHYQPGRPGPIRAIVIHATAGSSPGDLAWLRQGGDEQRPVSCHYYIDKSGKVSQLVKDEDTAWHAGVSRWTIDGQVVTDLNSVAVGIELENLNTGRDPYPEAQVAAAVALTRELAQRHTIPREQLVRHLEISPGRKTDPAGFPWASFVAQVYPAQPAAPADPQAQLHARMLDLAYRVAGGGLPTGWPLLDAARRQNLGMPIAVISGAVAAPVAGSAQDDRERPVTLVGQPPLLVEVFARDLLYAPVVGSGDTPVPASQIQRLGETPAGPLRDALLNLLFRTADPVNGFQPSWAFHQHYIPYADVLGVPIGPNHQLTVGTQSYACQHFALDTLCSPVNAWQTIYHLSELTHAHPDLTQPQADELRRALRDDLYRARTGRRYDPAALLTSQAEARQLGAPLGQPELVTIGATSYLLMPFARDVLACRLPAPDWTLDRPLPANAQLTSLLAPAQADTLLSYLAPSRLLRRLRPQQIALLGASSPQPVVLDVAATACGQRPRRSPAPDNIHIAATAGPIGADFHATASQTRWHYYIDRTGAVYRLCDEAYLVAASPADDGAIIIAVEGDPAAARPDQRAALVWLVRALATVLGIPPAGVQARQTVRSS